MFFDFFGALLSFLSTYFFIKQNKKAWYLSLLATSINAVLYAQKGIYADMMLEVFYFASSIAGLWQWSQRSKNAVIKKISLFQLTALFASIAFLFIIMHWFLATWTNSTVAHMDALTTTLSLAGQLLMVYKYIFTWIIWFIVDALYCWLYFNKGLAIHSILMLVYTFMAIYGYLRWRNKIIAERSDTNKAIFFPVEERRF